MDWNNILTFFISAGAISNLFYTMAGDSYISFIPPFLLLAYVASNICLNI